MKYDPLADLRLRYPNTVLVVSDEMLAHPIARAFWCPEVDVIAVRPGLDMPAARCSLGHEIAHKDLGDRPTDACWFGNRQESGACQLAARRLVQIGDLLQALQWSDDLRETAVELDVTPQVLRLRLDTMTTDERAAVLEQTSYRDAVA